MPKAVMFICRSPLPLHLLHSGSTSAPLYRVFAIHTIFRPLECVYACLRSRCAPPSAPPITFAASRGFARRVKGSNVRDNETRMRTCLRAYVLMCLRACAHARTRAYIRISASALLFYYCYLLKNCF